MATRDWASDIEGRLDAMVLPGSNSHQTIGAEDPWSFLNTDLAGTIEEAKRISANTADKAYRKLTAHANVTSYSLLENLHSCPRYFELEKLQANAETPLDTGEVNLDFAFGHAVGAGIQTFGATLNLVAAKFAAFLAWRAPHDAEKFDKRGSATGKSLAHAIYAVDRFAEFWQYRLSDWEVLRLPNGNAATELAFAVDFQNGFYHFGHVDTVLRNKESGQLAVWEGKTTSWENVNEATYANSNQALGYSVIVDAIAAELGADGTEYEVLYIVYNAKSREFSLLPFLKTRTQRAEWLQDTLLDHANLSTYQRIGFYPKRGSSCINKYGRECKWFGNCQMGNDSLFPGLEVPTLTDVDSVESLDFKFNLSDLIKSQQQKG